MMRASLASDQGSKMAQHARVSLSTAMPVYFADPHSPCQRPSNETPPHAGGAPSNRLYREYLPKDTEFPITSPTSPPSPRRSTTGPAAASAS